MTTPVRPSSDAGDLVKRYGYITETITDSDAVCRWCRYRFAHAADCRNNGDPWPTVDVMRELTRPELIASIAALSEENERLRAALRAEQSQSRMKY